MKAYQSNLSNKIQNTEGYLSIVLNTLLFGLKMWAGIVSNSVAIKADAWHTLSDSISSIIVIYAAKVSIKPADKRHPFGHGRAGLIASLFIGFILFVIAYEFIKEGVVHLRNNQSATFGTFAIVVTIVSILVKEGMAQFAFWGYKKTNDESLKADGWHHRSDALSSVILLIGIFAGKYYWWADGVLSFIIGGLMVYAAWDIVQNGINRLLGESPSDELQKTLTIKCNEFLGYDADVHHIHIHRYGQHSELTFHIVLPGDLTLEDAHDVVDPLENEIRRTLFMEATIHVDPYIKKV